MDQAFVGTSTTVSGSRERIDRLVYAEVTAKAPRGYLQLLNRAILRRMVSNVVVGPSLEGWHGRFAANCLDRKPRGGDQREELDMEFEDLGLLF
ncbi:hypothetical protein [Stieleria sedimenti]|uniref:hypothetical protein n=1 Tax=Stieleria sedimenti TaxID=2976331 RepID=UPI00217FE34A|nr:hypothetical protein [Stieleria sedimenti]